MVISVCLASRFVFGFDAESALPFSPVDLAEGAG